MCEPLIFLRRLTSQSADLAPGDLRSRYVLHLSNALGVVDSALTSGSGKKARKAEEGTEVARLRGVFQELDELAADKGESGLAISLSKPFQRLLKYPLLLQNLLYNTDPSTKEYEATVAMVEEVEHIIRSIEDEKTAVEERVKTRDVFARIEGLEREKVSPFATRHWAGTGHID